MTATYLRSWKPGSRQLALDVREVAGAALEPQDDLGGIPERQEKLPLQALADVPPGERHGLPRELHPGRQLEAVEGPRRGDVARRAARSERGAGPFRCGDVTS